jgi:hypothetical protein
MDYNEIEINDILKIKNATGTYTVKIISKDEEKAKCQRYNAKKGIWSKSSNFCIFNGHTDRVYRA